MDVIDRLASDRLEALKRIRRRGGFTEASVYAEPELHRLFGAVLYPDAERNVKTAISRVRDVPGVYEALQILFYAPLVAPEGSETPLTSYREAQAAKLGISVRALIAREDSGLQVIARALIAVIDIDTSWADEYVPGEDELLVGLRNESEESLVPEKARAGRAAAAALAREEAKAHVAG